MLALALFAVQFVPRLFPTPFAFEAVPELPGYRRLISGEISKSADPFIGLGGAGPETPDDIRAWVAENTCTALFRGPVNVAAAEAVPVASFSDYQCPHCRVLTRTLSDLLSRPDPPIVLSLQEFPVFGAASEAAAASAQAAGMQGAHLQFHERLMAVPLRPSRLGIERIAADLGLDAGRFSHDAGSRAVTLELLRTRALGDLFGFYGTPSMVVGRTLVVGAIAPGDLERLIDIEREEAALDPCRAS